MRPQLLVDRTADAVDSHYRRIRAKNAKIEGHARNFAKPGAEADDLADQAARAVETKPQYVTVLIGANDACADRTADMTSVATFRKEVGAGLARLKKGLPKAKILVASIPDLYRLWQLGHENAQAVRVWNRLGICKSMLANPTSEADADNARRRAVRDRITDYDGELQDACHATATGAGGTGARCTEVRYSLDLVNHVDYFHPNVEGQHELADVTWPGRFTW